MSKINFRSVGAFLGVFLLGGIAGFLVFWQGAKHGILWTNPDLGWVVAQDIANGKWDQAVKVTLARMHDERKDYGLYGQVSIIYLERADQDAANRDQWIDKALSYEDRAVSLGPDDWTNLLEAGRAYEMAGNLAKNSCPYYLQAFAAAKKGLSLVPKDSIRAYGRDFSAQPIKTEFDGLIYRLQAKVSACGGHDATAPNP